MSVGRPVDLEGYDKRIRKVQVEADSEKGRRLFKNES